MNNLQGWLNIYKPKNISSFEVIRKIRNKFKIKKIGHAGTLDPLAEGILPIAIGKTTKLISFINNKEKEYEFEIKWGEETSTDDSAGEIVSQCSFVPSKFQIENELKKLKGKILQKPPKASAVKINGIRAYKLFRSNKKFDTIARFVEIHHSHIIDNSRRDLTKINLKCGKGFYVRSFAKDLATKLGTKGHIFSLKRLKVGNFCLENSILLDDLLKIGQTHIGFRDILPSTTMLDDILAYEIDDKNLLKEISQGKSIKIDKSFFLEGSLNANESSLIFLTLKKNVLSFGKLEGCFFKPIKVLI